MSILASFTMDNFNELELRAGRMSLVGILRENRDLLDRLIDRFELERTSTDFK